LETYVELLSLEPHPAHPPTAIQRVACSVVWEGLGNFHLDFIVDEQRDALLLPDAMTPSRGERLWDRTCFELFAKTIGSDAYLEFNFSPSGQWAAYEFDSYRRRRGDLNTLRPKIFTSDRDQYLKAAEFDFLERGLPPEQALAAAIASFDTSPAQPRYSLTATLDDPGLITFEGLIIGLSAIIIEAHGTKSYWALRHPPGPPDFHHPDCFALTLPAPE